MKLRQRFLQLLVAGLCFAAAMLDSQGYAQTPGHVDETFDPSADAAIFATAVQPDGKIIIGGGFRAVGGVARTRLARLNPEGSLDTSFNAPADSTIECIAVQPDGKILIGGEFSVVGELPRNRLARLNADGSVDTAFNPNVDKTVFCISAQPDGKILIGGNFERVGGTMKRYFARLNADGSLDTSFNPAPSSNVFSTVVQADGKILVAGMFTTIGGGSQSYLARLKADGTLDTNFAPSISGGAGAVINCIAVDPLDRIVIAGGFTTVGGESHNRLARLNSSDGSVDSTFTTGIDVPVSTIALQANGKIVVGGGFTKVGGLTRFGVARLFDTGEVEIPFNPGSNLGISSLAVQNDGQVLVAGTFTWIGGWDRSRIARVSGDAATQTLSVPDSTQVRWMRGGGLPEVTTVTFETSADGGATWAFVGKGTRTAGGWEANGLDLPTHGRLRARAYTIGGVRGGSMGLLESLEDFAFIPVPKVTTNAPEEISPQSVTLSGTVNPRGYETEVWFEYGTSTSYSEQTPSQTIEGSGARKVTFNQPLSQSWAHTTCHYRVVARNANGTVYGMDQAFIPNTRPVAVDDAFHLALADRVGEAFTLNVLANDHDSDGDNLMVTGTTDASKGPVGVVAGTVRYSPGLDFNGNDSFTYTISDGYGGQSTATVTFTNALPVAADDQYHLPPGFAAQTFPVLTNDTDGDGDELTITGVTQGAKGTVTNDGTNLTYTPGAEFVGDDSFTYTIRDGYGGIKTATVTLVNAAPVANPDTVAVMREPVTIDVRVNDSDADGDTLVISEVGPAGRGQVTTDGTSITYTPDGLFKNTDSFSYTITDGRGKSASATVRIILAQPVSDYVAARGAQVVGLPEGNGFARFGIPSMSDGGLTAFVATLKQGKGPAVEALFSGTGPMLVTKAGNDAPGIEGGKFRDFKDPVLSKEGHLAFIASVAGVPKKTDSGIWTRRAGNFDLLVQAGSEAPETDGAVFSRFDSLAVPETGRVVFVASLAKGAGAVTDKNDLGVWAENEDGTLRLVLREQDKVLIGEEERMVKTISAFAALKGSTGQRRSFNAEGDLLLRLGFVDGSTALVRVTEEGTFHEVAVGGGSTAELEDAKFQAFGLGTLSDDGTALFRTTLKRTKGGVAAHNDVAILTRTSSGDLRLVARTGDVASEVSGALFKSLQDPVGNADGDFAFIGSMTPVKGLVTGKNDVAIWVSDEEGELSILVREGDAAPGTAGRKFTGFESLAFPDDRGVAFVATLSPKPGSAKGAGERGLWAQDSNGDLQLLVCEGQKLQVNGVEKPLKKLTVLSAVPSAPSQGGSYNGNGGFAYRATFTDGSEGVFTVWVP